MFAPIVVNRIEEETEEISGVTIRTYIVKYDEVKDF